MRKQDQSAGFTLIEALLALAIVAMVVTISTISRQVSSPFLNGTGIFYRTIGL